MTTTIVRRLASALFVALACLIPCRGYAGGPGDAYYSAHVVQKFKYYAFVNDIVQWTDETWEGTSLLQTAEHDTTTPLGVVSISTAVEADSCVLSANLTGEITVSARTGIYYQTFNDLDVSVYIRAPSGTPYDITLDIEGTLQASRVGGLPGGIAPLNGESLASFEDSTLYVPNGGVESLTMDSFQLFSGITTTAIVVNGETYSLARSFVLNAGTRVTQAVCIIGCMLEAAQFHALVDAHVRINVYPYGAPTDVPGARRAPAPMMLTAAPNPWSGSTLVSFQAPAGAPTTVDVFDVRGMRVARLFDAPASGRAQSLPWNASDLSSGVYFLRANGGGLSATKKVMLLK